METIGMALSSGFLFGKPNFFSGQRFFQKV
jgi:hypothetical protein